MVSGLDRVIGERAFGRSLIFPDLEVAHAQERRDIEAVFGGADLVSRFTLAEPLDQLLGRALICTERPYPPELGEVVYEASVRASRRREMPTL